MWSLLVAIIGVVCTFWLLFFTDVTLLQVWLIAAIAVANYIGDQLK